MIPYIIDNTKKYDPKTVNCPRVSIANPASDITTIVIIVWKTNAINVFIPKIKAKLSSLKFFATAAL